MTPEPSSSEAARPTERQGRAKRYLAWRVAAVVIVILVMLGLAHILRNPSVPWGGAESGDPTLGQWPPQADPSGGAPPPARPPITQRQGAEDLRRLMGGLVMAAIGDPDDPDDARHDGDEEAKRRFIADLFGVPRDQLRNQAPADLMPSEAKVLLAFQHPDRREARMILVRMPGDLGDALEAFCKHYDARGWGREEVARPDEDRHAQPDSGWLVRFHKGRRERIVYARARSGGEETLVAIYDPHY